jgi:hypothetical protein
MRQFVIAALLAAAAGCSTSTGPDLDLTGWWRGAGAGIQFTLQIADSSGALSGTGELASGSSTLGVFIVGTRSRAAVSLTIRAAGYEEAEFTGQLRQSGFTNQGMVLRRLAAPPGQRAALPSVAAVR